MDERATEETKNAAPDHDAVDEPAREGVASQRRSQENQQETLQHRAQENR